MERKFKERGKSILQTKYHQKYFIESLNLFHTANYIANILTLYGNDIGYDRIRKSWEKTEASLARNVYWCLSWCPNTFAVSIKNFSSIIYEFEGFCIYNLDLKFFD